jgi:hypothetical protein
MDILTVQTLWRGAAGIIGPFLRFVGAQNVPQLVTKPLYVIPDALVLLIDYCPQNT